MVRMICSIGVIPVIMGGATESHDHYYSPVPPAIRPIFVAILSSTGFLNSLISILPIGYHDNLKNTDSNYLVQHKSVCLRAL